MDKAITVDIESSSREEDVSITSNLSSIDSFYTMVQGKGKSHIKMKVISEGLTIFFFFLVHLHLRGQEMKT